MRTSIQVLRILQPSAVGLAILLAILSAPLAALAKAPELIAIEIYPVEGGQAYVEIGDFTLNTKNEVRLCGPTQTIDKQSYGKLSKVTLSAGMTIERDKGGVLLLHRGTATDCVVPGNLKMEKGPAETPAQLAEQATLLGQVLSKSENAAGQIAPFAAGVEVVFAPAADVELAEFLRAKRASAIVAWQAYLAGYPAGPHLGQARSALRDLHIQAAQTALAGYRASLHGAAPDYTGLKQAKASIDAAARAAPDSGQTTETALEIQNEADELAASASKELDLYGQALIAGTAGYVHLVAAETYSGVALAVGPAPAIAAVEQRCLTQRATIEKRVKDASDQLAAGHPDEAVVAISPVRAFAPEYDKVQAQLTAIYGFYLDQGQKAQAVNDLTGAITAFEKASAVKATAGVNALLKAAREQLVVNTDKTAVAAALATSTQQEADKDYIGAFETVDTLPPARKAMLSARLDELKDNYERAATAQARQLQHTHTPIKGLTDEVGIQRAYALLTRVYELTNDPGLSDQITVLGETLSAYYLGQAKHHLERPDGSGANIGWTYLQEAREFKASNINAVIDEMTRARAAYQLRSRLSISVTFRDQTSRREAVDFAEQLTDSLATGLESSGMNIKVVRPGEHTEVEPNFHLIGDVLQNSKSNSFEQNPKESKYRSGELAVVSDAWKAANRAYEKANTDLQTAQHALTGAAARGKKKEIKEASEQVDAASKRVEDARVKLDELPQTVSQQVERSYTYTEKVNHLRAVVELQFRVVNSAGDQIIPAVSVPEKKEQDFTVLENVKAEDTTGLRAHSEVPDGDQFLETVQYSARDRLIQQAKEKVIGLPGIILKNADTKASEGDLDGAAELYMLYLGSVVSDSAPDVQRVRQFLFENYNFKASDVSQIKG